MTQQEKDLLKLRLLEEGGVDNWGWYEESLAEYDSIVKETEAREKLLPQLEDMIHDLLLDCRVETPVSMAEGHSIAYEGDVLETCFKIYNLIKGHMEA